MIPRSKHDGQQQLGQYSLIQKNPHTRYRIPSMVTILKQCRQLSLIMLHAHLPTDYYSSPRGRSTTKPPHASPKHQTAPCVTQQVTCGARGAGLPPQLRLNSALSLGRTAGWTNRLRMQGRSPVVSLFWLAPCQTCPSNSRAAPAGASQATVPS